MIPVHNCFPFTLFIRKFHTKTPYESRMCTVGFLSLKGIWRNLTELNVLHQVLLAIRQHVLTSDWLRHFSALDQRLKCTIVIMRCQDKSIRRPFHIFDFSKTAERNLRKLYRKQEIIILYQCLCFFGQIVKIWWLSRPLIGWDIFDFSSAADLVTISSRYHRFRYTHDNSLIILLSILKTIYCYDIYIFCR